MSRPPDHVTVRVPGKINLHLGVGALRPDGFHELINVFHAVDVYDEVDAAPALAPGTGLSVTVTPAGAPGAEVPVDGRNSAWQAAALLAGAYSMPADVHLTIRKRIPVAGGMAGGSADAAAALIACARLWELDDTIDDLYELASEIGSDVAFPLLGGTALGTGRGEVVVGLDCATTLHWVLVPAAFGISAGAGYGELDRLRATGAAGAPLGSPVPLLDALAAGDVPAVAAALGNDLQPAAVSLAPGLAGTLAGALDVGRDAGALAAIVSGSGPTIALLCADEDAAAGVAAVLRAGGHPVLRASGPVGGATVTG